MTSVVSEAFAVSHRPSKTERLSGASGRSADGGFASLVESETLPEPGRAASRRDQPQPREVTEASETGVPASADPATEASELPEAAADDAAPDSVQGVTATDSGIRGDPVTPVVATCARAPIEAFAAPVLPAAAPGQDIPQATIPETADPIEAAPGPVLAPTPAATANRAASDRSDPMPGQRPVQHNVTMPAGTAAIPADDISGAGPEPDGQVTLTASIAGDDTEAPARPQPQLAAPVRAEANPGRPDAKPDVALPADDQTVATKPALDPAAQVATPSPAHSAMTQAAVPHASPLSAGQPVPVDGIAVEIANQARAGHSRFEIRLDPPELGRIDVRLDIDSDGNVKSRLVIERADTYDLLRRDQSTLERALQQAGLKTSDQALEFSLRDQGFAQRHGSDDLPRGMRAAIQDAEVPPSEAANGYARLLGARGGIDIRV